MKFRAIPPRRHPDRPISGRVRLSEWWFPLALSALLLALVWIPFSDAFRRSNDSERFMGLIGSTAIDDNNVYLGLMRQAAEGRTLFTNNFTPEPNRPILFNVLYLGLGGISRITGWSLDFTHRGFMAVSIVLLVLSIYSFIAAGVRRPRYRRFALVLACLGGGLLWLSRLLLRFGGIDLRPITSWLVEVNLFHAMLVYPHFVFAAALLTASLALQLKSERVRSFGPAIAGGACLAILAFSHAFEAVAAIPIAVAYLLLEWLGRGASPSMNRWKCAALVAGIPLPFMALNYWILSREPMWGDVVRRLTFYTPDPFRLIMSLGVTFFITVLTFEGFLRVDRPSGERMAKGWLLVVLFLAYVPSINWRWHLLNGIQIPLSVLATQGLRRTLFLRLQIKRRGWRRSAGKLRALLLRPQLAAAMSLIAVLACLSALNLFLSYREEAKRIASPVYLPGSEVDAMAWMSRQVPRDSVIFAAYVTGNYVPRLSGQRVFLGEDKLTAGYEDRIAQVHSFYATSQSDEARLELLRRFDVRYVFYGPEEKKLGPYDPEGAPFLQRVYAQDGVKIFRVAGPGGEPGHALARQNPSRGKP
ncbi:MAG TPA: hypothetical protein VGR67_14685 [Candidatus Polarisedimenticolia bacterium]|jgi:hypothetical protein|nr:hypothetical protein [Candidatus Polarisedimenticolia bacterium]